MQRIREKGAILVKKNAFIIIKILLKPLGVKEVDIFSIVL